MQDIFSQIVEETSKNNKASVGDISVDRTSLILGEVPPTRNLSDYLKAATGFIYACVSAIADEIGAMDIKLYEQKGKDVQEVEDDNEILNTISRANNRTTKFDLLWLTSQYLELTGEAPWFLSYEYSQNFKKKVPQQIVLLRPDKLTPLPGNGDQVIGGYKYRIDPQNTIALNPEEVVPLMYPDPNNQFRGKGTLFAAARTADIEDYSEEYNRKFFFNSGRPDSVFSTEKKLSKNQRESVERKLKARYGGIDNAHKTIILENGLKWQQWGLTAKDMDFLEQQRFTRDKILSIFRVPKSVVAITEDVNRANAEAGNYIFALRKIRPTMLRIIEQLNEFYVPLFDTSGRYFLDFTDPVPENTELKLRKYETGLNRGYYTINEVREMEGLEPFEIEDADKPLVPFNLTPLGDSSLTSVGKGIVLHKTILHNARRRFNKTEKKEKIIAGVKEKVKDELEKKLLPIIKAELKYKASKKQEKSPACRKEDETKQECVSRKIPEIMKENPDMKQEQAVAIAEKLCSKACKRKDLQPETHQPTPLEKQIRLIHTRYEGVMRERVKSYFKKQQTEILNKLGSKAIDPKEYVLDKKQQAKIAVQMFLPVLAPLVKEQSALAFDQVNITDYLTLDNPAVRGFLEARTYSIGLDITKYTNELLGKVLAESVKNGEGPEEAAKRVRGLFDDMSVSRSQRIARTEVSKATNWAHEEAYKESGVVEGKEWLTAYDERTCEWCLPMNGKQMKLGETFFDKGDEFTGQDGGKLDLSYEDIETPPLHNNCRCTLVPIIK